MLHVLFTYKTGQFLGYMLIQIPAPWFAYGMKCLWIPDEIPPKKPAQKGAEEHIWCSGSAVVPSAGRWRSEVLRRGGMKSWGDGHRDHIIWANYNNSLTWIVGPFGDDSSY